MIWNFRFFTQNTLPFLNEFRIHTPVTIIIFATDCVNRIFRTIPFWIDLRIFNFIFYSFLTPISGLNNLKYLKY